MTTTLNSAELGTTWFNTLSTQITSSEGSLRTGTMPLNGQTAAVAAIVPTQRVPSPGLVMEK